MFNLFRADPWGYRLLFVALALLILFVRLLPLGTVAGTLPGPDLMLCLTIAWAMRRSDYVPVWLILIVTLCEDLILMRPPGLWTALVIIATEFLRARNALTRHLTFIVEWALAAGLMLAMLLIYRFVFLLAFLPQPPLGFVLVQLIATVLCYPMVFVLSRAAFDLRKRGPGEFDDYARRS